MNLIENEFILVTFSYPQPGGKKYFVANYKGKDTVNAGKGAQTRYWFLPYGSNQLDSCVDEKKIIPLRTGLLMPGAHIKKVGCATKEYTVSEMSMGSLFCQDSMAQNFCFGFEEVDWTPFLQMFVKFPAKVPKKKDKPIDEESLFLLIELQSMVNEQDGSIYIPPEVAENVLNVLRKKVLSKKGV